MAPRFGSLPYAPFSRTPEMRMMPLIATGIASSELREGRSWKSAQASRPTITTWVLPSTVASPAPTYSIE